MRSLVIPFYIGDPLPSFSIPGTHTVLSARADAGTPQLRMVQLYERVAQWVAAADHPVVHSPDCMSPLGIMAGLQRQHRDFSVVWLDAHGDFNTRETSPSGYIGGMSLAMAVGLGDQTIVDGIGMQPILESSVILVDARSLDPGEDDAIARSAVTHVPVQAFMKLPVPPGPAYVHLDVDVLDPADIPGLQYPAESGPRIEAVARALTRIGTDMDVVAVSVAHTYDFAQPRTPEASALAARLLQHVVSE